MAIPLVLVERELVMRGNRHGRVLVIDMAKNVGMELVLGMVIGDLFQTYRIVGIERKPHSTMVSVVAQILS